MLNTSQVQTLTTRSGFAVVDRQLSVDRPSTVPHGFLRSEAWFGKKLVRSPRQLLTQARSRAGPASMPPVDWDLVALLHSARHRRAVPLRQTMRRSITLAARFKTDAASKEMEQERKSAAAPS